ncbi:ribonuclease catalytic domain-containing protein [Thermostichus vulcanus]|uniref:VacB/RNase II family 3'-5' exoribonuclease n=1 Tax=Thermostichus vulcanus str. 'Rupite' TaxID=2813851 RepID=A0ABT0C949_THEVL|nr:VacB/RNase II family 3'-5' exoribonuclease [Thermostichus vulcanus str. 'Rupite']
MEKGTLVEFRHNSDRVLAVVQGTEGKKNLLLGVSSGQVHSVHPRQITFALNGGSSFTASDIPGFWEAVQAKLDPESLAVAWELVQEDRHTLSLSEMAQLLFSDDSPISTYATYRLLSDDRTYFKPKGEGYEPRTPAQVKEILHQIAVTQQRQQEQAEFEAHVQQALAHPGQGYAWTAAERARLELLERLALQGAAAAIRSHDDLSHNLNVSDRERASQLLEQMGFPATPQGAFDALIALGLWSRHENLALRLTGIPTQFPKEVEHYTQTLLEDPPPENLPIPRRDLTQLHTYTIDDASTRDIDDALSIESWSEEQVKLWIHIADPSRWVQWGDPLDVEARKRGTSVYLPEQVIPMFPPQLSTGPMSLVQGEVRPALSFGIVLGSDGQVREFEICLSQIKVTYRLTYEDADEMLELGAEAELTAIARAAQWRYAWRMSQGAIQIGLPEQDIKVIDEIPHLRVIEDTPARQMVAEMMVLTGDVAARFTHQNGIPVPYRLQPAPDLPSPETLDLYPQGPVRSFAIMRCLSRAEVATQPGRHTGLGLDAYCQVTSPIRRYADLLAHYQIKAFLQGDPLPLTESDVQQLLLALEPGTAEAVQVERKSKRYWSIEYLRLRPGQVWRALVLGYLREHENLVLVMLDEIAFRVPVRLERQIPLGAWIELEVLKADPRADVIELRQVEE